ncbi:MAG: hypothetical protein JSV86_10575 [Gemmatimonadota bacterium]|nr:MAG: hypothetical protein JSV86_10575 [Gemmatimonadota bacterium]
MAIFRSILRVPLPDGEHELDFVQEDRADEVLVSVTRRSDQGKSLRLRPTIRIPKREAERIGKFLLGIKEIDDVVTEHVTREVTKPGRRDTADEDTQP